MSRRNPPKRNRRVDTSGETEATIAFTSRADGSRHRFRFLCLEEQPGMWRIHEVKEGRTWRIVGCEPIKQLRVGQTAPEAEYPEQHLID